MPQELVHIDAQYAGEKNEIYGIKMRSLDPKPRDNVKASIASKARRALNYHGMVYGAIWGLAVTAIIGAFWGIPTKGSRVKDVLDSPWAELAFLTACFLPAIPVGMLVTRLCAGWLSRGSSWRILWVAPVTLLMGTALLGFVHASIAETFGWLALGKSYSGGGGPILLVLPFWYVIGGFVVLMLPLPLALLNCWHLQRMVRRLPDSGSIEARG
jgi:hypothetical protein